MSWKKIGGLNNNESKRTVSDYEGNLYNKLIVNDLSVNNTIIVDESMGINLPPTTIKLDVSRNEQTLLNVGGNYKQTGSNLEIFNQNVDPGSSNFRRALVHDINDILQINPEDDYENSVEIYSSTTVPTKLIGNLDVSSDIVNYTSKDAVTYRSIEYYENVSGTDFSYNTFDVSSTYLNFSIDGSLNVTDFIGVQDLDISASSLADLYLASGSFGTAISNADLSTEIQQSKIALTHNQLDRLIINDEKHYTGGVQIKGGYYHDNIFLDGNVQIGNCPKSEITYTDVATDLGALATVVVADGTVTSVIITNIGDDSLTQGDKVIIVNGDIGTSTDGVNLEITLLGSLSIDDDIFDTGTVVSKPDDLEATGTYTSVAVSKVLTVPQYRDADNDAWNEAFTTNTGSSPSTDASFNLDIGGNCRVRGNLLYVDGDFIVNGSRVVINDDTDLARIQYAVVSNGLFAGYEASLDIVSNINTNMTCDISGGLVSRNNIFVGDPYNHQNDHNDTNVVGGIYFANTVDNEGGGSQTLVPNFQLKKNQFTFTGIEKREISTVAPYGTELLLYSYQYPQNWTDDTNNREADRIRLFAGAIHFDTFDQKTIHASSISSDVEKSHYADNSLTRMTISSEGKVGIGTNNPQATLDVSGNTVIGKTLNVGGNTVIGGTLDISGNDAFINGLTIGRGSGNILTNTAIGNKALDYSSGYNSIHGTIEGVDIEGDDTNGTDGNNGLGQSFTMTSDMMVGKITTTAIGGSIGQQLINGIENTYIHIREYVNDDETSVTNNALSGDILATSGMGKIINADSDYYPVSQFIFTPILLNSNTQYVVEWVVGGGVGVYVIIPGTYTGGQAYDINGINLTSSRDSPMEVWGTEPDLPPGNSNTAIGFEAGMTNHAGNSNTYLGSGTDCSGNFNNSTAIGSGSLITKSDQIVLGKNESPPEVYIPGNVGIGTNNPLFKLHVDGSIKLTGSLYTGTTEITPENLLTLVDVIIPLQEQLSGLQNAINTKQPTIENGHLQISYIDGLQTAIDAKQSVIGIDGLNIENILDLQTTITGIQADINSKLEEVGIDDIDDLREILTAKLEEVGIDDIDDLREILDSKQAVIGIDGLNIENIYGLQVAIEAKQDSIQDGDLPITVIDGLPTAIQSIQDAIATKQNEITGAASTIHDQQLDHQRVLVSNDLGKVIVSDITSSELEQLDGVSSNIQTQIDLKAPLASPTFTGNTVIGKTLNVGGNTVIGGTLDISGNDAFINGLTIGRGSGNILTNTAIGNKALDYSSGYNSIHGTIEGVDIEGDDTNGTDGNNGLGQSFTMTSDMMVGKITTTAIGGSIGQQLINGIENTYIHIREYVNDDETSVTNNALSGDILATSGMGKIINADSDYYPVSQFIFTPILLNSNTQYVVEWVVGGGVGVYVIIPGTYTGGQAYDINGINLTSSRDSPMEVWGTEPDLPPGNSNTAIGFEAGMTNHAGNSNTYLGSGTDCSGNFNNSTAIGSGSLITKSDQIVLGKNESPPEVYIPGNVGIGTNNPTNRFQIQDDDFRAIKFGQDSGNGIHHMDYYNAGNHNEHSPEATKEAVETSAKGFYINYYSKENIILNGNGGNGGNVGIGTNNPSEKLEVNGNVKATSYTATSDVRHKENICDLDRALEKICSIRGVNFNLKNNDDNDDGVSKKYAGILAQEVHEIIPEAICKKDDDKWTANYNTFIGYLIESVKTLKSENDEYKKGNEEQQTRIETLESKLETQGRLIQQVMDKMDIK